MNVPFTCGGPASLVRKACAVGTIAEPIRISFGLTTHETVVYLDSRLYLRERDEVVHANEFVNPPDRRRQDCAFNGSGSTD
jgi:hypothetical protein